MTDTTAQPKPIPSNQGRREASGRLRKIADWIDAHGVTDDELVAASTDGWDDLWVQVTYDCGMRLLAGREATAMPNGFLVAVVDEIELHIAPRRDA